MTEINRRYFEGLMSDKRMSLRQLAERMGMSHSQLSVTLSGTRRLQLDEAAKISQIFGQPLHRIVENAGVSVRPVSGLRVPVVGAMRGDGVVDVFDDGVIERTSATMDSPEGTVGIQCRTADTPLSWMDGWVFFCLAPDGIDPTAQGRLCYVKPKDAPPAVSTIKRGYRDGTYNLSGPFTMDNAALEWATPIFATRN